jgi:uncharacterized protein YdhG (YjbR/CyaY superfamily)
MSTVEQYLTTITDAQRLEYERIRGIVLDVAPGADEVISYNMPGFKINGKPLIWVGAFKRHMSIFPGTIKFTPEKSLSDDTIREILSQRLAEIS